MASKNKIAKLKNSYCTPSMLKNKASELKLKRVAFYTSADRQELNREIENFSRSLQKMTDEEKAKEWVRTNSGYSTKEFHGQKAIEAFLAGLKAGKEELNHKELALQSDMDKTIEQNIALKKELNKANEWHFVSKEGFPNKDDIYLIIRSDGLHLGDYCCGGDGDIYCQSWCDYPSEEEIQDDSVIAWKEIVLPKEIEND